MPTVEAFDPPIAHCPICGHFAICILPPALRAQQPDDTTMVCHPALGGCNVGFVRDEDSERLDTSFAVHVRLQGDETDPERRH